MVAALVHAERIRKVRDDEISEKTQTPKQPQPTQLVGQVKDEARQAVNKYVPVKSDSELQEVGSAI